MPEAEAFGCQCSVLAASHRCALLGQSSLQHLLVWHTACEIRAWPLVYGLQLGRCSWLHLGAKSALSLQWGGIVHEADKNGRVEAGSEREGSAFHVGRGYDPNLGWSVLLGTPPVWLANR